MPKTVPVERDGKREGWMILCPACGNGHMFVTEPNIPNGVGGFKPVWRFVNNDPEKPTFRESMLVKCNSPDHPHYQPQAESSVCHSMVTDGKIHFIEDSTHNLKGQTVDLPDFDDLGKPK